MPPVEALSFVANLPVDTDKLAGLITDRADLFLVWPKAVWPFDHAQWRAALAPEQGHRSYYIYAGATLIGHAALRKADQPGIYRVSFLYLAPEYRNRGCGGEMLRFLERVGAEECGATSLELVVRDYNPRALRCYLKAGYAEHAREGTAIRMRKLLPRAPAAGAP
jgi:RimJ/RimL family protein N-acetyltransferase